MLAGCVMEPWFGPVHDATVGVLTRAGYDVDVPEAQTCCGALAAHDGHAAEAGRLAAVNVSAFAGYDLVVSDSAGCTAHLKEYSHWTDATSMPRVVDVTELVATLLEDGVLPSFESAGRGRAAIQDPCHLRHAQRIVDPPRSLVRAAGYQPVEIDPRGTCCGAAGIYSVLQPDTSRELGTQKASQVRASGAEVVASANPGCEMQLRTYLGGSVRVAHPIELYWQALQAGG
jgi:glycolate oxidase iron-sulfur subunit